MAEPGIEPWTSRPVGNDLTTEQSVVHNNNNNNNNNLIIENIPQCYFLFPHTKKELKNCNTNFTLKYMYI